eukprot:Nk52_evm51s153 gene=Nk52_evmTU51s153
MLPSRNSEEEARFIPLKACGGEEGGGGGETGRGGEEGQLMLSGIVYEEDYRKAGEGGRGGRASTSSSVFNLSNSILGAGILALPYAMKLCGLVLGVLLLGMCTWGASFGLKLLVECAERVEEEEQAKEQREESGGIEREGSRGHLLCSQEEEEEEGATSSEQVRIPVGISSTSSSSTSSSFSSCSYFTVASALVPQARFLIDGAVAFKCLGVATSYLVVIGDTMSTAVGYWIGDDQSIYANRQMWILVFMLFCIPLAVQKSLEKLKFVSVLAIAAVVYLTVVVVLFFCLHPELSRGESGNTEPVKGHFHLINLSSQLIEAVPILVFAYSCHQNIFSIYAELKHKSEINFVIDASVYISGLMYFAVGICGYFTYFDNVEGNILSSYPDCVLYVNICRVLVALIVAFSYPLQIMPARISVDNLLFGHRKAAGKKLPNEGLRFAAESCILIGGTFVIGISVTNLSTVFAVIGSTGSATLCYILPGLFYLYKPPPTPLARKIGAVVMLLIGLVTLVAGNYDAIFSRHHNAL